jgi:ribosome-associated protein
MVSVAHLEHAPSCEQTRVPSSAPSLRNARPRQLHIEGEPATGWILMDYGSVVVHLFTPEMRSYYNLEELWRERRTVVRML